MGRPGTFPEDLAERIADLYSQENPSTRRRWTQRELAALASEELGRPITRPVIDRAIAPIRAERARITREVAREQITAKLATQLDALDTMMSKVAEDFDGAPDADARADALDTYQKGLALKLRYSGVGESMEISGAVDVTTDGALTDARSQLAAQLARAAAGALPAAAGGGAGEAVTGGG